MPDISMCANENCPSKANCYRFTAQPNPWRQAYADFKPAPGSDRCDSYTDNGHYPRPIKADE